MNLPSFKNVRHVYQLPVQQACPPIKTIKQWKLVLIFVVIFLKLQPVNRIVLQRVCGSAHKHSCTLHTHAHTWSQPALTWPQAAYLGVSFYLPPQHTGSKRTESSSLLQPAYTSSPPRGASFTAKIRRLLPTKAKWSVSYKGKQNFRPFGWNGSLREASRWSARRAAAANDL